MKLKIFRFLHERLQIVLDSLSDTYTYELILVDDGSKDSSWVLMYAIARQDSRVRVLKLSRNFGHQIALTAGYDSAQGDCIISMDADLQDPPELILAMIKKWEEGNAIIYARRINRQDGFFKKNTANLYYRLLSQFSEIDVPRNVGDFRLIDKKVLDQLKQCREKARYLRGMVAWAGFSCTYVDFNRPNRHAGFTGYTWRKMFKLAFDGMTSFSTLPLKLVGYCGVIALMLVTIIFLYMLSQITMYGAHYQITAWLSLGIFGFMAVQSTALWLLGEYIGRIYQEAQGRPLYIIEHDVKGQ